jgi:predicted metallopeptidase
MTISYRPADDVKELVEDAVAGLNMGHINPVHVACVRSWGSSSRRTIARIHGTPRIWQVVMKIQPLYIVEVLGERFDRLSQEDREKVIIHELLHIPKGFRGGLRCHGSWTSRGRVDALYEVLCNSRTRTRAPLSNLEPRHTQEVT